MLSIKVQNALKDINLPFTELQHLLDVSQIDTKVVLQKLILITGDNARLYSMYSNEICKYKKPGIANSGKTMSHGRVKTTKRAKRIKRQRPKSAPTYSITGQCQRVSETEKSDVS